MSRLLIDDRGRPDFGIHRSPVDEINYRDFDLRTMMDRPRGALARRMGFNQFQFIGLTGPEWCGGIAIVDLKWLSVVFFYVYDAETGETLERSWRQPLALGTLIEPAPDVGVAHARRGRNQVSITPQSGGRRVEVRTRDGIEGVFMVSGEAINDPLRVCSPAGYNRWSYTQKAAGLRLEGEWRWGSRVLRAGPEHFASVDWSCGHMRRETSWNWASLSGHASDGTVVGLNLATGINESGVLENALWVDGSCELLGQARFHFDRYDHDAPWQVTTNDGRVELSFQPMGHRSERVNAGFIASNFRQFFGRFDGRLTTTSGQRLDVTGLTGFMEDHYAKW